MEKPIFIKILDLKLLKRLDRFLIKAHIIHRSKKLNKSIPNDISTKIDEYENMFAPGNSIKFSFIKDGFFVILNGRAIGSNGILLTPEWAARLLLYDNDITQNAFLITLGHEITHTEGDFSSKKLKENDKKFVNWVNEIHADFGAAKKMVKCDRQKLMASIQYKMDAKKEPRCKLLNKYIKKALNLMHSDEYTHPTWETRLEYASNYDFDENLIKRIASETGCTNDALIKEICAYYKPIVLKQNIVR